MFVFLLISSCAHSLLGLIFEKKSKKQFMVVSHLSLLKPSGPTNPDQCSSPSGRGTTSDACGGV